MNRFDKLLSYIYPISIETTESEINPFLEVVYQNGKYILNSANTNYSYSGLYDLFNLLFQTLKIDWGKVNNALILGFGAGCVVPLIREYSSNCNIVGVEVDEKVIELGQKYFNTAELQNTVIVHDDAINYINESTKQFDLIIVDIYIDRVVPSEAESIAFIKSLNEHLSKGGALVFNKLIFSKVINEQIPPILEVYKSVFNKVELFTLMETGKVIVARK